MVNWLGRSGASVVLLVTVFLATACDGREPTTPTSPSSPPSPSTGGGPSPPRQSMAFEMTGVVTDDGGAPVSGAKVTVILDVDAAYGAEPWVLTDASGGYKVNFIGVPGSNRGPAGTEEAVAFVQVEASGYGRLARYLLGTTQDLVENFHVHLIKRITAGESAVLTIAPDDGVCAIDVTPSREQICGTVRVVAPRDGIMRVAAVPTQPVSELPMLTVYGSNRGGLGAPGANPTALRVAAGTEYTVDVAVSWGFSASQSFVVKTSM